VLREIIAVLAVYLTLVIIRGMISGGGGSDKNGGGR